MAYPKSSMASDNDLKSLDEVQYKLNYLWFYLLLGMLISSFAFISYFPLAEKSKTFVQAALKNSGCSPDYEEVNFNLIPPRFSVKDLKLPSRCFGSTGDSFSLGDTEILFRMFNFTPFGPHFLIKSHVETQPFEFYVTLGPLTQLLSIQQQALNLENLRKLFPNLNLNGRVNLNLKLFTSGTKIENLELNALSKNFYFPEQNFNSLTIPDLKINNFSLKAKMNQTNDLNISEFIIGDERSPIRAQFKGRIKLNGQNIATSTLKLQGEVAFSESFAQAFPIDLFFAQFDQKDGFYQIGLEGTLNAPQLAK